MHKTNNVTGSQFTNLPTGKICTITQTNHKKKCSLIRTNYKHIKTFKFNKKNKKIKQMHSLQLYQQLYGFEFKKRKKLNYGIQLNIWAFPFTMDLN